MQSALGRVLLRKLPQMVEKRRRLAAILTERFSAMPALRVTIPPPEIRHSYYKYYVFLRLEHLRGDWTRQRIIDAINAEGIPCFSGSCSEIYLEKAFPESMRPKRRLPVAKQLGESTLMFLVHSTLAESDMHDAANAVEKVLAAATN
jgi:dTDP-4-amino-4,6-dideoxygalactose transaminase